jgi:dUTP pyrophosphatase
MESTKFTANDDNTNISFTINQILKNYDKVMVLKLFVDCDDPNLKRIYVDSAIAHNTKVLNDLHHIDAGFDIFAPVNEIVVSDIENNTTFTINDDALRFFGTGWDDANPVNKLDFKVCCSAKMYLDSGKKYNTGYYMYPRSSISKTQLRLANSTGIIDAGYRGHLIGMFDVVNIPSEKLSQHNEADYLGKKYDRYLQICSPGLSPIIVEVVNSKDDLGCDTSRGEGGFGSTGR